MNPVRDEPLASRIRRGVLAFGCGLGVAMGVVWAGGLGLEDRQRSDQAAALDLAAACVARDGPGTVVAYNDSGVPPGWRCARLDAEAWVSVPISPEEGCQLLFGGTSRARLAAGTNPFAWECLR